MKKNKNGRKTKLIKKNWCWRIFEIWRSIEWKKEKKNIDPKLLNPVGSLFFKQLNILCLLFQWFHMSYEDGRRRTMYNRHQHIRTMESIKDDLKKQAVS